MEQEKQTSRVSRIEEFLLDPEKTIFELLEEFGNSVEEIRNALSQVDVANLETLKGEDGKTPERGVDYFTDEDLDNIEAFILDRIPVVGEDVPSPKQVNEYIDKQVAKIPRVKGDKGNPGTPGKPGKNGSPDSALDIIKKLRSLDKNQGLQLNDIRGLSKKIALLNEVSDEFTKLKEDLSNIKILTSGASSDGAVASVNGKVGVVVLTQDDIENGTTYVQTENNFTDALLSKLTGLQTSYSFLNLTDTPSDYTGQAGKFVKVNATNDGLEFDSIPGSGDMLASVYDPAGGAKQVAFLDQLPDITTKWTKGGDNIGAKKLLGSIDNQAIGLITNNLERLTILENGNVGIGTTAPAQKLDVSGNININTNGTNALISTYKGADSDGYNMFIGGGGQSSIGEVGATYKGSYNTANGLQALYSNTEGYQNTANGYRALYSNTTGNRNTANGMYSLFSNTTGYSNTANGMYSLFSNTTGYQNTANGLQALYSNTTGYSNTANGVQALYSNTTGYQNTANGLRALYSNTTGFYNTANGLQALYSNTTGTSNTANGYASLYSNTTGSNNSALGYQAGRYISDGTTGRSTGNYGLYLGYDTKASANGTDNEIVIGYDATGAGSNTAVIGSNALTDVYLGSTTPNAKLYAKGLNLGAGTATAGTAPLKLTSGTLNTTPEAGAIEFDGTDLYITI